MMLWYPEQDGYIYTVQHREVDVNADDELYPSLRLLEPVAPVWAFWSVTRKFQTSGLLKRFKTAKGLVVPIKLAH